MLKKEHTVQESLQLGIFRICSYIKLIRSARYDLDAGILGGQPLHIVGQIFHREFGGSFVGIGQHKPVLIIIAQIKHTKSSFYYAAAGTRSG